MKDTKELTAEKAADAASPSITVPTSLLWAARAALDDVNGLLGGEGDPEGENVAKIAELVRDELDAVLRPTVFPPRPQLALKARAEAAEAFAVSEQEEANALEAALHALEPALRTALHDMQAPFADLERRCIADRPHNHDHLRSLRSAIKSLTEVHGSLLATLADQGRTEPRAAPSSPSDLSARETELLKALRIALGWAYRYLTQRGLKLHCPECHRVWDEGAPPQHDEGCVLGTADAALTSGASAAEPPTKTSVNTFTSVPETGFAASEVPPKEAVKSGLKE